MKLQIGTEAQPTPGIGAAYRGSTRTSHWRRHRCETPTGNGQVARSGTAKRAPEANQVPLELGSTELRRPQNTSSLVLAIEARVGEMYSRMPTARHHDGDRSETKAGFLERTGIVHDAASQASAIAANPDVVEEVIADAVERGDRRTPGPQRLQAGVPERCAPRYQAGIGGCLVPGVGPEDCTTGQFRARTGSG